MTGVLAGVRVLDLTRVVAGPWCTQTLADLGATVYKIERPGVGDDTRRMSPFLRDAQGCATAESATFIAANRNKHSVTLDFAKPEGAALLRELAAHCDVFVENYKVGDLARFGLDEASVRALRPDVVYCSITGFGPDGPYATRPAYDFILQGMAGLMSTCGDPAGEPMRTGIPATDLFTGLYATVAVLAALLHRRQTGQGQSIDAAMIDASVAAMSNLATAYLLGHPVPRRQGNANPIAAPSGVYTCADGQCIVAAGNDSQFAALARVLGHPEWASDARFATNPMRVQHRATLQALLVSCIVGWNQADLLDALAAAGVPGGPINELDAVFADPQVQHRQLVSHVPHPSGVELPLLRSPLRLGASPVRPPTAPPTLGQHTEEVLHECLGLDTAALAGLRSRGVI